jgi:hypothetical protein
MNPAPIQPAAQNPVQADIPADPAPVHNERADLAQPNPPIKLDRDQSPKLVSNTGSSKKQPGGGSYEEALTEGTSIHAKANSNRPVPKPTSATPGLSQLGISTISSGPTTTVGSVIPGSVAERSGVKAGDVIESRDAKTIRVRRDGKSVSLELKP